MGNTMAEMPAPARVMRGHGAEKAAVERCLRGHVAGKLAVDRRFTRPRGRETAVNRGPMAAVAAQTGG